MVIPFSWLTSRKFRSWIRGTGSARSIPVLSLGLAYQPGRPLWPRIIDSGAQWDLLGDLDEAIIKHIATVPSAGKAKHAIPTMEIALGVTYSKLSER